MSDIIICRKHGKTLADARIAAEHLATELKTELDLNYAWDGDVMRFKRPGVSGELTLDPTEAVLSIRLKFFLAPLKPSIEREALKFFDENFSA